MNLRYHLVLSICPRTDQDANGQKNDAQDLQIAVAFASNHTSHHRRYTAKAPEDDVHRYGNVVGERPIIEDVDAEMHRCDQCPFSHRYERFLKSIWFTCRELRRVRSQRGEEEVRERNQQA